MFKKLITITLLVTSSQVSAAKYDGHMSCSSRCEISFQDGSTQTYSCAPSGETPMIGEASCNMNLGTCSVELDGEVFGGELLVPLRCIDYTKNLGGK